MLRPGLVLTNLDKRLLTFILYSYHILTIQDRKRDCKQSDKTGAFTCDDKNAWYFHGCIFNKDFPKRFISLEIISQKYPVGFF